MADATVNQNGQQLCSILFISYLYAKTFLISVDSILFDFEEKREREKICLLHEKM